MQTSNLELFKQALIIGINNKIDTIINSCDEEIKTSKRHKIAMNKIIYGRASVRKPWSPRVRKAIAILVAAALLLLSGCGIIFRNKIRELTIDFYDKYIEISYAKDDQSGSPIKDLYTLTYIPDGYVFKNERILNINVKYFYYNSQGNMIRLEQSILAGTIFHIDTEHGYTEINDIDNYEVFYKKAETTHYYYWNNGVYIFELAVNETLPIEEIELIIKGIKPK